MAEQGYYCPETGQIHQAARLDDCCHDPIMHIPAFEDVMDGYRRVALLQKAGLRAADEFNEAVRLLELANLILSNANFNTDGVRRAQGERFLGRLRAFCDKHT